MRQNAIFVVYIRIPQISGYVDGSDPVMQNAGKYIRGYSILFDGHQELSINMVLEIGQLLLNRDVSLRTKEALLMILAHHPSKEALNALTLEMANGET